MFSHRNVRCSISAHDYQIRNLLDEYALPPSEGQSASFSWQSFGILPVRLLAAKPTVRVRTIESTFRDRCLHDCVSVQRSGT